MVKGDFDSDGVLDIVSSNYVTSASATNRFSFQKGLGNGKFGPSVGYGTHGLQTQDIRSADFNNDGKLDVAYINQTGVYIWHGQGNGIFDSITTLTLSSGKYMAVGDFNEDGAIDIVATSGTAQFTLFTGTLGNPLLFGSTVFNITGSIVNMEVADMNGDNHLDVISYTGSGVYVSRNNNGSLGNFFTGSNVSTGSSFGADLTLCDIDNDSDIDVITVNKNTANTVSVLKNNGSGTLTLNATYPTELGPEGIDNFDINQDGFKDIVVAHNGASTISIFLGSAGGVLSLYQTIQAPGNPKAVVVGNFTSDSYPDIVSAQTSGAYFNSFVGNASNNYLQTNLFDVGTSPSSAFASDFNGDGNQDVAITQAGANNAQIYLGDGSGGFTAGVVLTTGTTPVYITGADLDNSGSMDLVVVNSGSANISVFYGTGTGSFSAGTNYTVGTTPVQAKIGHLNGDAFADIVVTNSGSSNFSTLLASGATSFGASTPLATNATPHAILITDYDLDGINDVIVGHNQATPTALLLKYKGTGTGSFTANGNIGVSNAAFFSTTALESADLDGDGDADIILGRSGIIAKIHDPTNTTLSAAGVSTTVISTAVGSGAVAGIKIADVNNDGKLDVIGVFNNSISTAGALGASVATNFGIDAAYTLNLPNTGFASELDASGLAIADFNNDGRVDAVIPNKGSNSFTLHLNTTPVITAGGPTTFCNGNSVTLTSTAASQWYDWDPNNETTQAISASATGPYYVVTSSSWSDWCQAKSDTITVTATPGPATPTVTAGGSTTFCSGGSVVLTSSQATGNQWYKNGILITGAVNQNYTATTPGVYTVTYTTGGCTSDESSGITVTASETPVITADGPTTFCTGGSVVLTSSVTSNLLWSNGATTPSITVTTSGTYSVQNIVGGCPTLTSNTITVTVASSLSTPTISPAGPITLCPSGSVTLTSSSPTNNIWSNGATTQSITVNAAGSYFVHLDNGSCVSANSATVTVTNGSTPATPTITAGGSTTFCAGGSVTLTSSSGSSYLWSTGATTQSINVTTAGSYTVQVASPAGCQSASSAPTVVTVNAIPSAPTITAGGPTTFCAGGSVTLTSSAGNSYLWSNGATTASINVTTSGSYTVQITDANGCQSTASTPTVVTVNALPAAPTITAGGPTTFCAGGSVTLTSSAGNSYLWSTGATTASINVTTSGSYAVQITDANGCQSTASTPTVVTVNALPAAPTITAGGPTTFCAGGSVTLTSSAGNSYLWSNGATTASINVTTSGSYTVQVTNPSGCQSTASAPTVVTVNALPATPTITAGGPTTFCAGGSVTLTSSAGNSYLWSTGATTASINVTTSGSYTVQITDANGCQSTASTPTVVTVNALPAVPTITAGGPTTFCNGNSVTLTSSSGNSYLWSNGATTASINVITSGSYTVQITDANGCQSTASTPTVVTVNPGPPAPTITAGGATTFCAGGSVTLTSSAGNSYLWSIGATTASINVTTSGSYTVQITDAAGCQSTASTPTVVTVNPGPPAPTITAGGATTFCAGGSVTLTSSAGNSYLWSTGATTASINITTSGSYSVQVTNADGCLSAASTPTVVTVNALPGVPTITAGGPTTFCAGGSVTLTSSAENSYLWSNGATTASINVTAPGSYTVQVTNAAGCQSTASTPTAITVNPAPAAPTITASGATTFCAGGSVTLTSSAGNSYLWSTGATTASINVTTSGSYTVQITDANGCQSTASTPTVVTVNALPAAPTITPGGSASICAGGSVTLTSSSGTSYMWSTGETSASINVTSSGSYTVQITDANGCTSPVSSPTTVTVNPLPASPTITAGGATTFCAGGSVTLTSSAGNSYLWSTGETTASINATTSGNYTLQVTDATGCQSPASSPVTITVNALPATPTITAGSSTTFCSGGSVILTSSTGNSYLWSTGETTQSITVSTSGSYTVQVTDALGCQSVASAPTSVTVNALPATPTISASGSTTFCLGSSITLTSSAETSYLWSTGETTQSIVVSTSGSYTAQVTNAAGCLSPVSSPTTVTVNALPGAPTATAGGPTTFCAGGSVVLTSSSTNNNLWSTGETTQSITVTTSGNYSVQKETGATCLSAPSNVITVTVNPLPGTPTITSSGSTTFCAGNSVTLTSSTGVSYLWSTGETTQSITVSTSGSYSVQITDANGCTSLASIPTTVTVNPIPSVPTITAGGPTTFCDGGSVVLSSSATSGNLWSTGETTQSITVTTSGSYTVEEITAGCASGNATALSVTVNPNPAAPTITAGGPTTFCAGGSVVLTSSASADNVWSTSETTQSITVTTSGSYSVEVSNGFGCTSSSTPTNVTVNPIPSVPTITAGGSTTICSGNSIVLTSAAVSGNLWSTGETTQSITVSTAGSYTVEQVLLGCSSGPSAATNVMVNPTPAASTITAGGPTTFCAGGSVVLTSTPGTAYLWSTGETTQSITVTASGSYSVTIVDGACSSAASNVITVTVNPIPSAPTITAGGPTTLCTGGSVVLTSSYATGNIWSTGETTQSITVSAGGTYTVNATVSGCTGPDASQTITVNPIPAAPTVTPGGPTTFCSGGSVVLTSSVSSGNTWSTTESTQSISVSTSGSYTVTQTVLGCTSAPSAPIAVTVSPLPTVPTVTASGPTTFCAGGSVTLTSSSTINNFWSNGATTQSITVSSSGTFVVQVISGGCSSGTSAPTTVTVNPLPLAPTIVTGTTESICSGSSVTLTSSSTGGNLWSTGETTQSIVVSAAGSYFVTVTDGNGCTSSASASTIVTVNPLPAAPVINADGPTSFCFGGSVALTSSYSSNNLWSSGSTANTIVVSSNGTYTVTHTDANGCTSPASDPVIVTVNSIPSAPVITASGPTSFCTGGSVTLTSSQSTGNSWSTAALTPSITVTTGGVYSVIYIDGNGCASPASAPVVVNVFSNPAPPSITAGGATTICQGSFVTLTSSYTSGNTWSMGGNTQSINATVSGAYAVTYTNANGCSSTSPTTNVTVIPVSAIPTISASGSTTICDGANVTLTSSDPNSTWSTGATTQSITITTSGSYSVVGNQTGCPSQPSAPVVVTVNPAPAAPIITPSGPTTICEGEELFLFTSGTGTNTWSTGYTGQVLQVTATGNYWVSVQNAYGCSASSTVLPVIVNPTPAVSINPFADVCTFTAPFTMSNGLPAGGTYTGDGITANIFYPAAAGEGSSIVTYTYVDVNNCSASALTTISVNSCLGIDEKEQSYFSLFPNPNNGQFRVESSGTPMDHIIIYDAQGKMVFNESYPGIFTQEFDLNAYSNGVYYIEISSDLEIRERIPLVINH
jgi:hypothetical protein